MNNKSKKNENLKPQDSEEKDIKPFKNDDKAVIQPKDQIYTKDDPEFKDPAKTRETAEQPVNPIKNPPKNK
ncbi:hypothetical protein [Arcticibacter eurypsychrophilus]|uniref:hypothetical protein n=1 Tax=Arcticibacter eurypsychrophilus TaxID=1434752 RepID=UPI00084D918E|nr:hypothetical protein [Arcticibacter eurypsychrophilus]